MQLCMPSLYNSLTHNILPFLSNWIQHNITPKELLNCSRMGITRRIISSSHVQIAVWTVTVRSSRSAFNSNDGQGEWWHCRCITALFVSQLQHQSHSSASTTSVCHRHPMLSLEILIPCYIINFNIHISFPTPSSIRSVQAGYHSICTFLCGWDPLHHACGGQCSPLWCSLAVPCGI